MQELAPGAWKLNEAFLDMWQSENLSHDWILPDNFHVHVKVMSRVADTVHFLNQPFEVYRMENQASEKGRSLGANVTHSLDGFFVREITRRCMHNPERVAKIKYALSHPERKSNTNRANDRMVQTLWNHYLKSGFLSARILDHLNFGNAGLVDASVVLKLINTLPAKPFQVLAIHDCFRVLPNYGNDIRYQYTLMLHDLAKSNMLDYIVGQIVGKEVNIGKLDPEMYKDILASDYALS